MPDYSEAPDNSATRNDVHGQPSTSPTQSLIGQLMTLQTQIVQANSQLATCLQQIASEQSMTARGYHKDDISDTSVTPTILSPSMVDLEKIVTTQTVVLQQVSQLTALSQRMMKSQVGTRNESVRGRINEAQKDMLM